MSKKNLLFFIPFFLLTAFTKAQDTLPRFSTKLATSDKVIIGWVNNFEDVKQISIQRSFDSLKGYKTILTVADPTTKENGYLDAKAPNEHMFYRLYILRSGGNYLFSKAQKPKKDSTAKLVNGTMVGKADTIYEKVVKNGDTIIVQKIVPFTIKIGKIYGADSVKTIEPTEVGKVKTNAFIPSSYVYTERDGYLRINLPQQDKPKNYTIKFFEQDGTFLFELKEVKEKTFRLDKTNFYHAGWFTFELYEESKLVEKHKFHLDKDF